MKNILLIENDPSIIKQISKALDVNTFYLYVAKNSAIGYEYAMKHLPTVIICNNEIYEAKGNEILFRLRDETFIATIPFIFLIGNSSKEKRKTAANSGFDYYIKKPFDTKELKKVVSIAIEKYENLIKKSEKKMENLRGSISFSLPHEFFTPLNGILGFSELLIKDFDTLGKDEMTEMLRFIRKDAQRLKSLTENFLVYAQLEMISKDAEMVNALRQSYFINTKDILSQTAKEAARLAERENDLLLELEDAAIRMSEGYLRKLIAEITSNAFKFSEKGTQVILAVMSNDTSIMISIIDDGRGMTAEQIASIGAYMQFNRKIYDQQGTGLGLIIAKKITELHGGEFFIESKEHGGTKINMIFDN